MEFRRTEVPIGMAWRFGEFTLNPARAELTGADGPIHVDRHTLDVLIHLVRNADRVVTRDELLQAVWGGRIVSDATISTAIKHARKAVGDSGARQKLIRTVHGRGFRFVAELEPVVSLSSRASVRGVADDEAAPGAPGSKTSLGEPQEQSGAGRPSLAVLRFQGVDSSRASLQLAQAFPAEIIASLSRVGWLHMISRSSSFQFDPVNIDPVAVGARLGVRYLAAGTVEIVGDAATLSVEMLQASDGALILSERFVFSTLEIHIKRAEIVSSIASAIELAVPEHEARMSRRLAAHEFDAWSHYHLGLAHLYRFNAGDNLIAGQHFQAAAAADPDFARAHAGLSFVHWQTAFMRFGDDRRMLVDRAIDEARRALEIDPKESFAAFNLGRAHWLEGDLESSASWIDRALRINPNSAQSNYSSGLVQLMAGAPGVGGSMCDKALSLSPLDPMSYAMHGTRAMARIMVDDFEKAQRIADLAVNSPGAHFYINMIAAAAYELGGSRASAERRRDRALAQRPGANSELFFQAFPYQRAEDRQKLAGAFRRLGLA